MKRHILLTNDFTTQRFSAQSWAIEIPVSVSDLVALVCELALIRYRRAEQLKLSCGQGKEMLLSMVDGKSAVNEPDGRPMCLSLSDRDVDFVLCFLLTWYRDGLSEVNHIDLELVGSPSAGADCTLTVSAEASQPPLPGKEVARFLRKRR